MLIRSNSSFFWGGEGVGKGHLKLTKSNEDPQVYINKDEGCINPISVWGLGIRAWDSGFRVQSLGLQVPGVGLEKSDMEMYLQPLHIIRIFCF